MNNNIVKFLNIELYENDELTFWTRTGESQISSSNLWKKICYFD
jgi:hypothetical protein